MQEDEQSEPGQHFDDVVPYVRGAGWPGSTTVNDAPMNPWSKQHWNLTAQAKIIKRDRAEANRLARSAGHRDVLTSRRENAK